MSGTVPPPPPPPGSGPEEELGTPPPEQRPPSGPTPVEQGPVQRVSTSTRMPPAISPASQFAQAVTPAPAAPGAPVVQSLLGGGETAQQQYYDQYQQQGHAQPQQDGQYQQGYAQPPQGGQYQQQGYAQSYPPQGYDQYGQPVYSGEPGQQPEPGRKKLSVGWIAFIVLDVVLVVAAIVFAVSLFSSSDDETSAGADPSESTQQQSEDPEPEVNQGLETDGGAGVEVFAAPSLNIICTVSANAATCGIAQLDQEPAPDASCGGASGFVARVDPSGTVTQPCIATADQPKTAPENTAILNYGEEKSAHGFTCLSARSGMKCAADSTSSGFSIARAGIGEA